MKRYTKQIRTTLGLLSSMVKSDQDYSNDGERALRHSLDALEQLDSYIDSKHYSKKDMDIAYYKGFKDGCGLT